MNAPELELKRVGKNVFLISHTLQDCALKCVNGKFVYHPAFRTAADKVRILELVIINLSKDGG